AIRDANTKAAQVASDANKQFTEAATKIEQQKKADNFLSVEYLSGPMYAVIFSLALVLIGIGYGVMEWGAPYEDDDGDGIPNYAERDHGLYDSGRAEEYWRGREPLVAAWPQPGQVYYRGERHFQNLPDGSCQVVESSYSQDEIGKGLPTERKPVEESV